MRGMDELDHYMRHMKDSLRGIINRQIAKRSRPMRAGWYCNHMVTEGEAKARATKATYEKDAMAKAYAAKAAADAKASADRKT